MNSIKKRILSAVVCVSMLGMATPQVHAGFGLAKWLFKNFASDKTVDTYDQKTTQWLKGVDAAEKLMLTAGLGVIAYFVIQSIIKANNEQEGVEDASVGKFFAGLAKILGFKHEDTKVKKKMDDGEKMVHDALGFNPDEEKQYDEVVNNITQVGNSLGTAADSLGNAFSILGNDLRQTKSNFGKALNNLFGEENTAEQVSTENSNDTTPPQFVLTPQEKTYIGKCINVMEQWIQFGNQQVEKFLDIKNTEVWDVHMQRFHDYLNQINTKFITQLQRDVQSTASQAAKPIMEKILHIFRQLHTNLSEIYTTLTKNKKDNPIETLNNLKNAQGKLEKKLRPSAIAMKQTMDELIAELTKQERALGQKADGIKKMVETILQRFEIDITTIKNNEDNDSGLFGALTSMWDGTKKLAKKGALMAALHHRLNCK